MSKRIRERPQGFSQGSQANEPTGSRASLSAGMRAASERGFLLLAEGTAPSPGPGVLQVLGSWLSDNSSSSWCLHPDGMLMPLLGRISHRLIRKESHGVQTGPQLDSELPVVQGTRPRTPACGTMNGSGTLSFPGLQLFSSLKCIPDTDPYHCACHFYVSTYIARWSHSVIHSSTGPGVAVKIYCRFGAHLQSVGF